MLAFTIEDQKIFTKELLTGTAFDNLLCSKVVIHHNIDYVIEGRYNLDFYSGEERDEKAICGFASWAEVKPHIFQIMKGKHLPLSFQIILRASQQTITKLLASSGSSLLPEQVEGLFLNILYNDNQLSITTGSSYSLFTMDKSLELAFDEAIKKLITRLNIAFH